MTTSVSSAVACGSRTPLLPDINNPHKQRSFPKQITEKPEDPDGEIPAEHEIKNKLTKKPLHHNICVEMLCEGFHRSFAELFALLQHWDKAERNPHKLQMLQQHLTQAETAERAGQYGEAYENHMLLARFFTDPEDEWLKHHFLQLALRSARKFKMDSGRRESEANLHMGQFYLEKGELELALEHYEVFYEMTLGRLWQDSSGRLHFSHSCEELQTVYTLMAQRSIQKQDYQHAIKMSSKAYEKAKESGDRAHEGEAAYRLGLAYQSSGDQKTARQFFDMYMETSSTTDSLGRAYEAIAKSLESEGKLKEATEYLERFAEISLNGKQDRNLEKTNMCLGNILRLRKQYDSACVYFERAYATICDQECVPLLQKAQVCVASVRALSMMKSYHTLIQTPGCQNIQRILSWKERREDTSQNKK